MKALTLITQSPEALTIVVLACIAVIILCFIGYKLSQRKNEAKKQINEKIDQLESIVRDSQDVLAVFDSWMYKRFNVVEARIINSLAPAKRIVFALEQRLDLISKNLHNYNAKDLSIILDQNVNLMFSAVDMVVVDRSLDSLPEDMTFVDCADTLRAIFRTIKHDISIIDTKNAQRIAIAV